MLISLISLSKQGPIDVLTVAILVLSTEYSLRLHYFLGRIINHLLTDYKICTKLPEFDSNYVFDYKHLGSETTMISCCLSYA